MSCSRKRLDDEFRNRKSSTLPWRMLSLRRWEFHSFARKIGDSCFRSVLWTKAFFERFTFLWELKGTDYVVKYKGAYTRAGSFSPCFSLFFPSSPVLSSFLFFLPASLQNWTGWKGFVTRIDAQINYEGITSKLIGEEEMQPRQNI